MTIFKGIFKFSFIKKLDIDILEAREPIEHRRNQTTQEKIISYFYQLVRRIYLCFHIGESQYYRNTACKERYCLINLR